MAISPSIASPVVPTSRVTVQKYPYCCSQSALDQSAHPVARNSSFCNPPRPEFRVFLRRMVHLAVRRSVVITEGILRPYDCVECCFEQSLGLEFHWTYLPRYFDSALRHSCGNSWNNIKYFSENVNSTRILDWTFGKIEPLQIRNSSLFSCEGQWYFPTMKYWCSCIIACLTPSLLSNLSSSEPRNFLCCHWDEDGYTMP